jgi:hypothetical protein
VRQVLFLFRPVTLSLLWRLTAAGALRPIASRAAVTRFSLSTNRNTLGDDGIDRRLAGAVLVHRDEI